MRCAICFQCVQCKTAFPRASQGFANGGFSVEHQKSKIGDHYKSFITVGCQPLCAF